MKFLRLKTADDWLKADEEIAKVRVSYYFHSRLQRADAR